MAQETVAEQVRQARILAAKFKYSGGPEGRLAAWIVWLNDTLESRDAEVAELRAERDGLLRLREVAHWECDCVPDLGPTHCHACSDAAGHPVEWADSTHGPSAEVAELRARVDPQADSLRQKLWEYLGTETYLCDRDASAWGYGTMSLDDFRLAREDDEFMDSVLDLPDSPMKGDNR